MEIQRFVKSFLFLSLLICQVFYLNAQELLKTSDVSKIMHQIFEQHIDQKEMKATILKHAFNTYIDQFDPLRIYLLEDEVASYINLSEQELNKLIQQYKNEDYSVFIQLNETIQKAIIRARDLRKQIESDKASLFANHPQTAQVDKADWTDPDLKLSFAKNSQELKMRIQKSIVSFIDGEKKRFGEKQVLKNQTQTLTILNRYLTSQEDAYLYRDEKGQPLNSVQKENLFTMHVLKALAGSLDSHTTFYSNSEAYDMKVRLEKAFQGIGVVLQQDADGSVIISKLVDGGPAAKSGLVLVDDHILTIDGKPVVDTSLDRVMDMIRGENGTSVALVLQRKIGEGKENQTVQVTLKREPIAINDERVDVSYEQFGDGIIGKITLHAFYQGENGITSENDVRNAIKDLSKKGNLRGLILDLRENSGGFLTQAVKVAGIFISSGVVVISKYSDGHEHYYRDMDGREMYKGPLIILVSKATASAAEIVAQALQDYGVAIIVGDERTYGKGTIQSQTVTDSNKATTYFKVTVGKYYTVSGKTPQIKGVKSDILVPGPFSEEHIGEQYLEYALPSDSIKPEYKDDLADVDQGLKSWYLRFYIPTLQHKLVNWDNMIPNLKKNSEYRIAHNKNYQAFLRQLKGLKPETPDVAEEELKPSENNKKNFNADDLQMLEAVNIVKDMIMLSTQMPAEGLAKKESK